MSTLPTPACPICRTDLALTADGALDAWVCPQAHGLAFTLSEAYERLTDGDIHAIWSSAKTAPRGTRGCPMCERTMAAVPCESITLDVCTSDEVFWFDRGELDVMPPDAPSQAPTAEEAAALEAVTEQFGDALAAGWAAEERATITGKLAALLTGTRTSTAAT